MACNMVCKEFDCSYSPLAGVNNSDDDNNDAPNNSIDNVSISTLYSYFYLTHFLQPFSTDNIFDNLPSLALTASDIHNKLNWYLATDTEDVQDGLLWWHERCMLYPCLSHMAQDYLSIPGKTLVFSIHCFSYSIFSVTSINVEQVFSQGHLLLSHICSHLSIQLTCALLCLVSQTLVFSLFAFI